MSQIDISAVKEYLLQLQAHICTELEKEDGLVKFITDNWQRPQGGGGRTRVIRQGHVIEQGGVNYSYVHGGELPKAVVQQKPELAKRSLHAMGVSVVVHPFNPYVPTSHFNVRFIAAEKSGAAPLWWFGGGFDLTPYYGFVEDCIHWHQIAKKACQPFGEKVYPEFKKQCDEYFYLKHRQEPRGIGGLFFDYLHEWGFDKCFAFIKSVGDHYLQAYQPIIAQRKTHPFTQRHKDFQLYRRGRYVEFNLIYDRGTLFGLQSGGRTESIFMSLPPQVNWHYNWQPKPDTEEAKLYHTFLKPTNWLDVALQRT